MEILHVLTALNGGELGPSMVARTDFEPYRRSLALCKNFIPLPQGPIARRPGTVYVGDAKYAATDVRLIPFRVSGEQAHVLEFGEYYVRVFFGHTQVQAENPFSADFSSDFGGFSELETPYPASALPALSVVQSFDTLYICHADYAPMALIRYAEDEWTIEEISFSDGPYLPTNTDSAATITLSGTTGTVTATANAAAKALINYGDGFSADDLNRQIRITHTSGGNTRTGWGRITRFITDVQVEITVVVDFQALTASSAWRLGAFNAGLGYPAAVGLFQDRLWLGGCPAAPERIFSSISGNYRTFRPFDPLGTSQTPLDSDAVTVALQGAVTVKWLQDGPEGLFCGTDGGVYVLRGTSRGSVVTPTNVAAIRVANHSVAGAAPVVAEQALLYGQGGGRRIWEAAFSLTADEVQATDASLWGEHLLRSGVDGMAYQSLPYSMVWFATGDGGLAGLTYEKTQGVVGWHRHTLGGAYSGGAPEVISLAVVPTPDGLAEELWLAVRRTVAGVPVVFIEYMAPFWVASASGGNEGHAIYLDAAKEYYGAAVDQLSVVHLTDQTVGAWVGGSAHPEVTATGGTAALTRSAASVIVGLPYDSQGTTLPLVVAGEDRGRGAQHGRPKRVSSAVARVLEAGSLNLGPDLTDQRPFIIRAGTALVGSTPLVSGEVEGSIALTGRSTEATVSFSVTDGGPCTLASLVLRASLEQGR